MPQSFEAAWAATDGPDPDPDTIDPGTRIVVTLVANPDDDPSLYVGATGVTTEDLWPGAVIVEWDDPRLANVALLHGHDGWDTVKAAVTTTYIDGPDDLAWHLSQMLDNAPDWPALEVVTDDPNRPVAVVALGYSPSTNTLTVHTAVPRPGGG